jgi:hypothetical protein
MGTRAARWRWTALAVSACLLGSAVVAGPSATIHLSADPPLRATVGISAIDLGMRLAERSARPQPSGVASPTPARGEVFFYCCDEPTGFGCFFATCTPDDPPATAVPAGTILRARDTGLRYRTLTAARMTKNRERYCVEGFLAGTCYWRSAPVRAVALRPGRDHNGTSTRLIAPALRTLDGTRIWATMDDPFLGGLDGGETILLRDDVRARVATARDEVQRIVRGDAQRLAASRGLTPVLLDRSWRIEQAAALGAVGTPVESGTAPPVIVRLRARVVAYRESRMQDRARTALLALVLEGRVLDRASVRYGPPRLTEETFLFDVRATTDFGGLADAPALVNGHSATDAVALLKRRYRTDEVRIDRAGFPWPRMPILPSRITVVVDPA